VTDSDNPVPNPSEHNQWYPFLDGPLPPTLDGQDANPAVDSISNVKGARSRSSSATRQLSSRTVI